VFLEIFKKTIKDEKDRKKTTVFNGLLRPEEKDQKDSNPAQRPKGEIVCDAPLPAYSTLFLFRHQPALVSCP
jgi:hypothetical protein